MNEQGINTHFVLVIVAIITSCFTGFWTIPLALAALVFSLRSSDLIYQKREEEAKNMAKWAKIFGWLTIFVALIPVILIFLCGGTILALLGAALAAGLKFFIEKEPPLRGPFLFTVNLVLLEIFLSHLKCFLDRNWLRSGSYFT